ncbi:MAG TPA: permease [Acidimicrobiales bacterium]|nr:permease [Acidimicrobiales bacterium]
MLAKATVLVDIGRSLREGFFMFWETLWPLILGFGLAGAVQAFVSRDSMQQKLGDHRPLAVVRASAYGMVSSSCSYAASAMAKSLFVKGADYLAAMVFMFASTNLVLELGIVLVVLMGWQFAVSEFIGGFIMIALLATVGGLWLRGRRIVEARDRLNSESDAGEHQHGPAENMELQREPWSVRLRSKAGWADSATYTMSDLTMLRRELVIGYTVAGFLAVLVPTSVWRAMFISGHGFWTTLENAIVGPFIAIISFVCSIGNVPLAAALWSGGISFGGVISFIFADLIAFPLLMIYRRYYGTRLMLRMLAVFWALMSTAGLITEGIFGAAGLIPTVRPTTIAPAHFSWNYTTYLNITFLALFGLLYWTYRNRERLGAGTGYAKDPVCGMQVEIVHAPASLRRGGERYYFCSDHCAERFGADPERHADQPAETRDCEHRKHMDHEPAPTGAPKEATNG